MTMSPDDIRRRKRSGLLRLHTQQDGNSMLALGSPAMGTKGLNYVKTNQHNESENIKTSFVNMPGEDKTGIDV